MGMEGGKGACVYARTSRDNATRQSKICLPWGWRGERGRVYMRALHVIMLPDNLKFACHGDGWGVRGRVISDLLPTGLHQCSTTGLQQPDTHNYHGRALATQTMCPGLDSSNCWPFHFFLLLPHNNNFNQIIVLISAGNIFKALFSILLTLS